MKVDKKLIEKALILEGKIKPVEWASDFSTVEEMLRLGVGWKNIQTVLNEKYQKSFTINGLCRTYMKYHLMRKLCAKQKSVVSNEPEVLPVNLNSTE